MSELAKAFVRLPFVMVMGIPLVAGLICRAVYEGFEVGWICARDILAWAYSENTSVPPDRKGSQQ